MRRTQQQIRQYLVTQDPTLEPILAATPHPRHRRNPDLYLALLRSIMAQQLSGRAAATIFNRFLELFPTGYPDATILADMTVETLRGAGVSRQKATYLRNVAVFANENNLSGTTLQRWSDEAIIAHLTEIKGVGVWTVQMLLMFPLNRPDVLPVDDLTIQQTIRRLYRLRSKGTLFKKRMCQVAEPWRPYRSIVCKYFWAWRPDQSD